MNERDEGFLLDMLEAVDKILVRVAGLSKETYDADEDRRIVFTHLVQVVGEAASRISQATRDAHPAIPWQRIVGTRHRIVHDYLHVDTEILWEVVTKHVAELRTLLLEALETESPDDG